MENKNTLTPREELASRELPPLQSREEMKEILQREVYGYLPEADYTLSVSEPTTVYEGYAAWQVNHTYVTLTVTVGERSHGFRVDRLLHTDGKKRPLVVFHNFHPICESRYFAMEEMTEYDADILAYCYTDVSSDDGDFENGLAPLLLPRGREREDTCGKIGIWAWAAMRVVDYALTLPGTDAENLAIVGHSRLGKTALFTAMLDERIKFVYSNAAGCTGDALSRGCSGHDRPENTRERGELISDIVRTFPFWFCKNYAKYTVENQSDTFDQHFLLAAIAPRYVMIGSCSLDAWADPISQQLCALAASEAWEKKGLPGLVGGDRYLDCGEGLIDGRVGYFLIRLKHFLSRHGWRWFMRFMEAHRAESV